MNHSTPKKKKQYIRLEGNENLYVIPYIRGRLVFAELVARAIEEDGFKQVVIDLPYFMNRGGLWEDAIRVFPHVSSLMIRMEDSSFVAFPFVPNDAACMSLAAVQMQREWGKDIDLKCIDDSQVIHYPRESMIQPELKLGDDYCVFTEGLQEYFREVFHHLDLTSKWLSKDQIIFGKHRAALVTERLQNSLHEKKKTLFVCEYRLWWLVQEFLELRCVQTKEYFSHKWKDVRAALVIEEPLELWSRGAMDDYPSIIREFHKKSQTGSLHSFDKIRSIKKVINTSFLRGTVKSTKTISIRKLLSFYRYLSNRLTGSGRYVPLPLQHLYDAAYSCWGKNHANHMAREFLRYPRPDMKRIQKYLNIKADRITVDEERIFHMPLFNSYTFNNTADSRYAFNMMYNGYFRPEEEAGISYSVFPEADRALKKELGRADGATWITKDDYIALELASSQARNILARNTGNRRIKKSWGSLEKGIHWKSTILSKAKNENAIYIMCSRRKAASDRNTMNEFTPVAYIFTNDFTGHTYRSQTSINSTRKGIDLYGRTYMRGKNDPPPDEIYHGFYTLSGWTTTCNGHVHKRRISSIALTYNRAIMDVGRYEILMKRPKRFQCRRNPVYDTSLNSFDLSERGVAWAIKNAEHTVIVVAPKGWNASVRLTSLAQSRNISIRIVSLSIFNHEFIDRLRTMFFTSSQLRKHPKREAIVNRYRG